MTSRSYHLAELEIARDASDPRRSLPTIRSHHRRVLDVGCGAGQTLIASGLPAGTLGVGIDVDHDALALGQELAPSLVLLRARGEALPFATGSFDLVICRVVLPYMHIGYALGEMARVLAPGGDAWIVLHPWRMTVAELASAARRLRFRAALRSTYVIANSLLFHLAGIQIAWRGRDYESFQTARGIRRALARAGFTDVHVSQSGAFVATARRAS